MSAISWFKHQSRKNKPALKELDSWLTPVEKKGGARADIEELDRMSEKRPWLDEDDDWTPPTADAFGSEEEVGGLGLQKGPSCWKSIELEPHTKLLHIKPKIILNIF